MAARAALLTCVLALGVLTATGAAAKPLPVPLPPVPGPGPVCKFENVVQGECCVPCRRCCTTGACALPDICQKVCLPLSDCGVPPPPPPPPPPVCKLVNVVKGSCCTRCRQCCVAGVCTTTNLCLKICLPLSECPAPPPPLPPKPVCKFVKVAKGSCCTRCRRCCKDGVCTTSNICQRICLPLSECRVCSFKFVLGKSGPCCKKCRSCCEKGVCKQGGCLRRCFPKKNCY